MWRAAVRGAAGGARARCGAFDLSPSVADPDGDRWLEELELLGLDGVVAKRLDHPVDPGGRGAVVKVKPDRTADCVVVGVRWKTKPTKIATLLLGLYDDDGEINYVGSAAVAAAKHDAIAEQVMPLLDEASDRRFSEPNRWGGSGLEEQPLRPELVAEVRYDKVQGRASGMGRSCSASGRTRIRARVPGPSCGRRGSLAGPRLEICSAAETGDRLQPVAVESVAFFFARDG